MATRRESLTGRRSTREKYIDMEEVYHLIDKGATVEDVAARLGVCKSTLYRHHNRYQKQLEKLDEAGDEIFKDLKMEIDTENL